MDLRFIGGYRNEWFLTPFFQLAILATLYVTKLINYEPLPIALYTSIKGQCLYRSLREILCSALFRNYYIFSHCVDVIFDVGR